MPGDHRLRPHPLPSRYKYLVLSHATSHYRALGRLLGNLGKANLQEVADSYIQG